MPFLKNITYRHLIFLLLAGWNMIAVAQTPPSEYQVKATFLFNFTRYVQWPATSFETTQSPFVIGILGHDPFGPYLKETVAGENVHGHPIIIQKYSEVDEIKNCHILFINISQPSKLESAMQAVSKKGVLTIGDAGNFMQKGGILKFYDAEGKIKFEINPERAKAAELTISSQLMKLAKITIP